MLENIGNTVAENKVAVIVVAAVAVVAGLIWKRKSIVAKFKKTAEPAAEAAAA